MKAQATQAGHLDARGTLLAGGIVDAEVPGVATAALEARTYTHPALPGRRVVRFTPDVVGDATDVEMSVLGFDAPESKETVGRTVLRALGFPAWAVVNDPKHARFALEVMQEFRKAARKIKSKPGLARDEFVAIAKRLERSVPHFLPSFWEEAGRAFVEEGSLTFAAQCFEKARDAEKAFKLEVDENQRSRAYLEFALAGAVATKSLAGYASDLVAAFGAKDGYQRFFDLVVQRTRGGVPPWTGMAKDLRKLAKGAGIDAGEADRALVASLIESPSLARAPAEFWSAYRDVLVAMAKADPAVRARVRWLFPRPAKFVKLVPEWLAILEETGAANAFVLDHADAASEPAGAAGRWASELTLYARARSWGDPQTTASPEYLAALTKVAPRIIAEGTPVLLASSKGYWRTVDLDVLERALELGMPLVTPGEDADDDDRPGRTTLDLDVPFERDPVRLAAHPRLSKLLIEAVATQFGKPDFEARAKGKAGFVEARRAFLAGQAERLEKGALPAFQDTMKLLTERCGPEILAEFPAEAKRIASASAAEALRRSLAAGLLDELGWPDFEAATKELSTKKEAAHLSGTLSRPVVYAGTRVVVFNGSKRATEHSLPTAVAKNLQAIVPVGDALLVQYFDDAYARQCLWSTDPSQTFTSDRHYGQIPADLALADGGVTLGGRAIHVGDRTLGEQAQLVAEGDRLWVQKNPTWNGPMVCQELDPATGSHGRASWPKALKAASELDDGMFLFDVKLLPAPPGAEGSLLGVADGHIGWYVRRAKGASVVQHEVVRVDGVRWRGLQPTSGLLMMPGRTEPTAVIADIHFGGDHDAKLSLSARGEVTYRHGGPALDVVDVDDEDDDEPSTPIEGFRRTPPAPWLHYLRPRDEKGSRALAAISTETCARLLKAAIRGEATTSAGVLTELATALPELTHPLVRAGVASAVLLARALQKRQEDLGRGGDAREAGLSDDDLRAMLPIALDRWGNGAASAAIARAGAMLAGGPIEPMPQTGVRFHAILPYLGRAMLFLGSRAAREADREKFAMLVRIYAESPFALGMKLRRATVTAAESAPIAKETKVSLWVHEEGTSRYLVHAVGRATGGDRQLEILEAYKGEPRLPSRCTLGWSETEDTLTNELFETANERAFLEAALAEMAARGGVPYRAEDATQLAEIAKIGLTDAKLVVLGMPGFSRYGVDFVGKELREQIDVKVQDAKLARERLKGLGVERLYGALAAALEGLSPADLFEASTPEHAARWVSQLGRGLAAEGGRMALRVDVVDATRPLLGYGTSAASILEPLLDPSSKHLHYQTGQPLSAHEAHDGAALTVSKLTTFADAWPHLALELAGGDPYLVGMSRASAALRATLARPDTILPLSTVYFEDNAKLEALMKRIDGAPIELAWNKHTRLQGFDDGVTIALRSGKAVELCLRTGGLLDAQRAKEVAGLEALAHENDETGAPALLDAVRFLLSDAWARWMARAGGGGLPDGAMDADPRVSAPRVVAHARKEIGVGEAAAVLYLELLALPAPTDKRLLALNRWTAKELETAGAELVAKKLVVEGKRERAGRSIFLPGGWERRSGHALPVESWKVAFYGGSSQATIREAPGELYARALERALGDDRPRFEEVAAVRKPKGKKG